MEYIKRELLAKNFNFFHADGFIDWDSSETNFRISELKNKFGEVRGYSWVIKTKRSSWTDIMTHDEVIYRIKNNQKSNNN